MQQITESNRVIFDQGLIDERNYWIAQLTSVVEASKLDLDPAGAQLSEFTPEAISLNGEVYQRLAQLTGGGPFLTYTILTTAMSICLQRYTGDERVVIGSPSLKEGENSRSNTLAIAIDVDAQLSFRQQLVNTRQTLLDAYKRQNYPFNLLLQDLNLKAPLFDVALVFADIHCDLPETGNRLTLIFTQEQDRLSVRPVFDESFVSGDAVTRFIDHFVNILSAALKDPNQSVSDLELMSASEIEQVLVQWNETISEYEREVCVHELVAEQAALTPDAVAVICGAERITYGELDQRANQVANYLRAQGVGPEVVVGICLERSVELIVGTLGILKAGGAYLPLDPEYPSERLEYMVADSGAKLVLTELAGETPARRQQRLPQGVQVARNWEANNAGQSPETSSVGARGSSPAPSPIQPDSGNLAYVIYTSGSTGQPKGVAIQHRSLLNLVSWHQQTFAVSAHDRATQVASLAFDAAVWEVWPYLTMGATLVLLPQPTASMSPEALRDWLIEEDVTISFLPTPLAEQVMELEWPAESQLRIMLTGGDKLHRYPKPLPFALVNNYGPTENTVVATSTEVESGQEGTPSIGGPIANTFAYVLDQQLRPVPVGVKGELYLGGESLARGYLGRAELTAERFIPNPYSEGARLYRTGDVVRWNAAGELEFVGRADEQVKVRGYRIELGEVEAVLARHQSVAESVVVVRGEQHLVGYVVAAEGVAIDVTELREYLGESLPAYMIPAQLVAMESLPLTANGKVDRKALAAAASELDHGRVYEAPRTTVEELLAEIWAKVLGVERVGIHDNFFELGGDSILSIQSIVLANRAGLQLSPKDLFAHQTVAKLAAVAGSAVAVVAEQGLVNGPVALTPIQQWFFEQELSEPHHFNQTLLLEVRQTVDAEQLAGALRQVVQHHDALRLRFDRTESGWSQVHGDAEESLSFSVRDLSQVVESEQSVVIEAEAEATQASLNLTDGPILRVVYFDLGEGRPGRLLLVCHHLVVDGFSWRILLADLQDAYRALAAGEVVQLPAKSSSFQQWSETLGEYAGRGSVQEQVDYWLRAEREQVQSLPRDNKGENSVGSTAVVVESLSREETEALLQEVPSVYHTQINEVLLSGLAVALGQWTKQNSVLLDMEGHGREPISERVDVSRTVGWFTTIYPVLLKVDSNQAGEILKQVKEQVRGIPEQGLGYGVLRYLGDTDVRHQLSALPQAEVSFNYLGQIDRVLNQDTLFGTANESSGSYRSESGSRRYLLEVNAMTVGGRLEVSWSYSSQVHNQETIATLAAAYVKSLRAIIAHCKSAEAGGYTPSDFPLAQLTAGELQAVVRQQRRGVEDVYPLSPMQEGLLFHSLFEPQGGLYVEQVQNLFKGALDLQALRTAWERVQERHAILRSSFRWESVRRPVQVVHEQVPLQWNEEDWSRRTRQEQEAALQEFLRDDRERGFAVTEGPLHRYQVLRLAEDEWQLVWSFHHILLDGWCLTLVLQEVYGIYEALVRGEKVDLGSVRPYRDYIEWLEEQDLEAAENYWRQRLAGFNSATELGIGSAAGEDEKSYGEQNLELSEESTRALETLAREQQVTLNTVVQGAWAVLLSRYSGTNDVVYGVTVSGRPAELVGVEQMVGLFINTLPVRVKVESDVEVGGWLQQLQVEQAEMRQYEYSPLVEVQGWSEVERGAALFETLVAFENYPLTKVSGERRGSESEVQYQQEWAMERTNYPLTLLVGPGERLKLRGLHEEQRFDAEMVSRVLRNLRQILEEMVANPQQRVGELRMIGAAEEKQVVVEWNETTSEYAREACIHELFAEQVKRNPDAIAVVFEGVEVSYGELDQRANQVAARLRLLGVGPDVVVGICVERSVELIVGLLGILKAGGAYLPLDADYPQERIDYMLADAGVSVVLTEKEVRASQCSSESLCLSGDKGAQHHRDAETQRSTEESAACLAYVIYTSGSTGQPKGVGVPHRAVVRLVQPSNYVKLDETEVVLQMAPVSFDASTFEIWGALLNGAKLVVMKAGRPSLAEIAETVKSQGVTTMWLTAGLFQVMATEQLESLREVKQLLAGGDVLGVSAVNAVLAGSGERVLINGYGPTENTTFSCCHVMKAGEEVVVNVPIGKPITNSTAYVLDERMRPVPVGVRGELYVGGDGLARGYVGRAELTAEKFVPNPFSNEEGARLYRTGDVVRWNAAGVVEFIGRADQQVKVRGYRIELGEVEETLQQHESILASVVIAREQQLVAYVVTTAELEANELRAYLETKLPEYMIPSLFVELTELPLTANGKVDRKALANVDVEFNEREYEAPRTAVEELLAGIWAEVLGVARVGTHDNFFELGGHSLMATQVISRVRETFKVELPLRSLFEAPDLTQFSHQIQSALGLEQAFAPAIERVDRDTELPLSFAQQRLWFLHQLDPLSSAYHVPAAIQLRGRLDLSALERSFAEIIRRHESLRTVFPMRDGRAVQQILPAGPWQLEVIDLSNYTTPEREVERLATAEAAELFDLSSGPLWRAKVLRLSESEHVLLMTMHHIISDGWSFAVLVQEVGQLYERFLTHEVSHLPELPVQYADYAMWQRQWLNASAVEDQLCYWRRQLSGASPVLELPTDYPRPAVQSFRGASRSFAIAKPLADSLQAFSQRENVTLFITLLAAFQLLLSRYSRQQDIIVGSGVAGRNRRELEGLIGFFVNTLVLRTDFSGQPTVRELLGRVREVLLEAHAHQDVPFEQLVEELRPERNMGHQPLFQVMFSLQNAPREVFELPDLTMRPVSFESRVAKFDITFTLAETPQGLEGVLEYSTDLFEAATIDRMLRHYEQLLKGMVADPQQITAELPLLNNDEEHQLLSVWNETQADYELDQCVHQLVATQNPEAIAVICGAEQVTYGELDQRANQVANYLRSLGVGPEVVVGICMERSVDLIVGMLGILKAGAAYLPLDPEYPQERLDYMVADAGARIVLKDLHFGQITAETQSEVRSGNLAYVIYTSGSTGTPKGVAVQHRSLMNLVSWHQRAFAVTANDRATQVASLAFDAAVWEIWPYLTTGATLVLLPQPTASMSPEMLRDWLIEQEVTISFLPTPLAEQVLELEWPTECKLRTMLTGGDKLHRHAPASLPFTLVNNYGPTESTVVATSIEVGESGVREPSIGQPIANTNVYVLDEQLRPVPQGVKGELYLSGEGLARGYLGRAELTAERFIPNPYSEGARLYRTGDLVRWLPSGELEFMGRADEQVKVRGYRIELGEIEAVLNSCAGVSENAVIVREEAGGEKRLVAYLVATAGEIVRVDDVREFMAQRVPSYMIPSSFIELAALPLTANGKVDRMALPALGGELLEHEVQYVAPRNAIEKTLAGIWAEVLGVERVGVEDNFFELGGDSILSIQIIARANQAGLQLSPKDLFEQRTVAGLAAVVRVGSQVEAEQGLVKGLVKLTPIQHWFLEQEIVERHHFNHILLVELREAVDPDLLAEAAQHMVLHHDALRLRFQVGELGVRQYHGPAEEALIFNTIDLTNVPESEQREAIEETAEATQSTLNFTDGPLVRFVYFDMGHDQPARLLMTFHHLVIDGVSWRILLADLQAAYRALAAGETVQLPPKSSSFQQWSQAMQEYAGSSIVQEQVDYWLRPEREQVKSLPRDYDGENLVSSTAVVEENLSREETEALLQEVPGVYHTQINEVLLSALALTLSKWSESSEVLVDMEGHGREPISERVDVSRTVGWFTTIYPVLLEVADNREDVGEVVKQIKEQMRAIPGQGLGYGVLRYLGDFGSLLASLPQAEVSFNYVGQMDLVLNEETLFAAANESGGNYRSQAGKRFYVIEVNAMIAGGRLKMNWSYSSQVHAQETIAALAADYAKNLRAIIEHCKTDEAGGYTPSDFPLTQLHAEELAAVLGDQRDIEDVYPLSPMQAGLLFHSLYAPQGGLYVEQVQNLFQGELDLQALRTAWERVQQRHAILRSSFRWEGVRRPVQVVQARCGLQWQEEDWSRRSRQEQEVGLREFLRIDRERGFEMTEGPLHRYQVLRLAENEWQLVWSFHHILLDGWCLSLVLQEVYQCYEALMRGEEVALERPRPYRDYIEWLEQQDLNAAENYWRQRLSGFRAPTQLGLETVGGNDDAKSYGERNLELSEESTRALEALAREQQVTLNTVAQGAWAVLMSRYSGERDVVYGVTVSGRPAELAGVEQMIGLFINTLPLRVEVESGAALGPWLQRLQAEQTEMRQYEYSPLVEVQGWSEVERGVGLFETLLAFENYPVQAVAGEQSGSESEVKYEQVWAMERTNYPVTVMVGPNERLRLRILFEEQRYSAETIDRVLGHLAQVLESMAAGGAQQRVGELRLLSAAEEQQVVTVWNTTQNAYPEHYRVHELIEAQAAIKPDTIAVVCEGEQISYGELDRRANQLANYLQQLGVGPDVLVGVCVERSVAMIVGLLGILKAGGAYLPLDPDYPRERLSYMAEDGGIRVLLTQEDLLSRIPDCGQVVCVDSDWSEIESCSADSPIADVDGKNIVYVIYTSGSTGKPKGVMVTNQSLVNLCYGLQSFFGDHAVRNTALITSLSFDISVNQIFPTLIFGKTLHVIPNHIKYDSHAVIQYAADNNIHLMDCVPSYLNSVLTEIDKEVQTSFKYLLVGGEKVERSLLQKVFTQLGDETQVINIYGLTEITDINAWSRITAANFNGPVTIGGPLQNTQIYITNEDGQLQPIGIAGELCIGGDGLSRGYRNRPDLTAEKFIVNPYGDGALMCRTGDVGRWLKDGRIELFGRRDQQVKVNGYRLETGEIEAVLDEHPRVVKSAVVAHKIEDSARLVAYFVSTEKATISGADMREYLTQRVPAYMVPTFYVEMDQMPLTPNGKVDRKALPAPDQDQLETEREYVAPRTPVEEMLSDIWSDVLGVEQISMHDDFFDLGGHSLLATQVISRVRKTYNIELPLRRLFETSTIARFAQLIEESKDQVSEPEPSVVPISRDAYRTRTSLLRTDLN